MPRRSFTVWFHLLARENTTIEHYAPSVCLFNPNVLCGAPLIAAGLALFSVSFTILWDLYNTGQGFNSTPRFRICVFTSVLWVKGLTLAAL